MIVALIEYNSSVSRWKGCYVNSIRNNQILVKMTTLTLRERNLLYYVAQWLSDIHTETLILHAMYNAIKESECQTI